MGAGKGEAKMMEAVVMVGTMPARWFLEELVFSCAEDDAECKAKAEKYVYPLVVLGFAAMFILLIMAMEEK
jgi:hypothetical protein